MFTRHTLAIESIRLDGGTQLRAEMNNEVIAEWAAAMKEGAVFPAVDVYFDGTDYWLADGFHRITAARQAGINKLEALVHRGGLRSAILHAAGANQNHGIRRSNADKRAAVMTLLMDEEWVQWSDRRIATACVVHHDMVGTLRAELVATGGIRQIDQRIAQRNGRDVVIDTSSIGENQQVETVAIPVMEYTEFGIKPTHYVIPADTPPDVFSCYRALDEATADDSSIIFLARVGEPPNVMFCAFGESAVLTAEEMGLADLRDKGVPPDLQPVMVITEGEFWGGGIKQKLVEKYGIVAVIEGDAQILALETVQDRITRERRKLHPITHWIDLLDENTRKKPSTPTVTTLVSVGKGGHVKLIFDGSATMMAKRLDVEPTFVTIPGKNEKRYALKLYIPEPRPGWFTDLEALYPHGIDFLEIDDPELKSFADSLKTAEPKRKESQDGVGSLHWHEFWGNCHKNAHAEGREPVLAMWVGGTRNLFFGANAQLIGWLLNVPTVSIEAEGIYAIALKLDDHHIPAGLRRELESVLEQIGQPLETPKIPAKSPLWDQLNRIGNRFRSARPAGGLNPEAVQTLMEEKARKDGHKAQPDSEPIHAWTRGHDSALKPGDRVTAWIYNGKTMFESTGIAAEVVRLNEASVTVKLLEDGPGLAKFYKAGMEERVPRMERTDQPSRAGVGPVMRKNNGTVRIVKSGGIYGGSIQVLQNGEWKAEHNLYSGGNMHKWAGHNLRRYFGIEPEDCPGYETLAPGYKAPTPEEAASNVNTLIEHPVKDAPSSASLPFYAQSGDNTGSYEWYTPEHIIERVKKVLGGHIGLDPASCEEANKTVGALDYFTKEMNGLEQSWQTGTLFLNPPYGAEIGRWVNKLADEYEAGNINMACLLVKNSSDTEWFQRLADCPRCHITGRLKFGGPGAQDNAATFSSVVIGINVDLDEFAKAFGDIGDIYVRYQP